MAIKAEEKIARQKRLDFVLKLFLSLVLLAGVVKLILISDGAAPNTSVETKHKAGAAASVDFAKCLKEKGLIMYGDDTCEYCQTQKKMFGDSFEQIKYVNCYFDKEECDAAGVKGYPYWVLGNQKLSGIQTFSTLAALTGCKEP